MNNLNNITSKFLIEGTVSDIKPLGNGLINDTYRIQTVENDRPNYVLQRINHHIFTDVDLLQHNVETVTNHIREQLKAEGADDIDRRVLRFVPTTDGKTYHFDGESYWRVSIFISDAVTMDAVTPESSYDAGKAFGDFEARLADIADQLGETIPDFHNMCLRRDQLRKVYAEDPVGRAESVKQFVEEIEAYMDEMCLGERLLAEGKLQKRVCHCDTKVNNMMFDKQGKVLCVIDLDTVMPSLFVSDYGDFLRTAANTIAEDSPEYDKLGIIGDNGVGKSTFIKILQQIEPLDSGELEIGETVKFGYYRQDFEKFDESKKVIDYIRDIAEVIYFDEKTCYTASQFLSHFIHLGKGGINSCLSIESIEDRLYKYRIHAPFYECPYLFTISFVKLIISYIPRCGIGHVR